MTTCRHVKGR